MILPGPPQSFGQLTRSATDDFCPHHDYEGPMENIEFQFDNSYAQLPERFYTRLPPTKVTAPQLVIVNEKLAHSLALDPDALS